MTIFQLVKIALDELYKEGQKTYGVALDAEIKARMLYCVFQPIVDGISG